MKDDFLVITDCTDCYEGLLIDCFNNINDALNYYSKDYNHRAIIKFEIVIDFQSKCLEQFKQENSGMLKWIYE